MSARERTDDRRRRQAADRERAGTREREEDMAGRPDRQRRRRGVERDAIPAVAFPPREHAGVGGERDGRGAGPKSSAVAMKNVSATEMLADTATKLIVNEPVRIPQAPKSDPLPGMRALSTSSPARANQREPAGGDDKRDVHAQRPRRRGRWCVLGSVGASSDS